MGSARAKAEDRGGEQETFAASLQGHTPSQPLSERFPFLFLAEVGIVLKMYLNEIFKMMLWKVMVLFRNKCLCIIIFLLYGKFSIILKARVRN